MSETMEIRNPALEVDLAEGRPLRLEIGAGKEKRPGFYSLDLLPLEGVDVVADLNQPLSLLPDNSVECVFSNHVLEHVNDILMCMRELHRIVEPRGHIETVVPHFSNPYQFSDPTHVRTFGLYSMCYFVPHDKQPFRRKVPSFYSDALFELEVVTLEFFTRNPVERRWARVLGAALNSSTWSKELYEGLLSRLLAARQIRYIMRPMKEAPPA